MSEIDPEIKLFVKDEDRLLQKAIKADLGKVEERLTNAISQDKTATEKALKIIGGFVVIVGLLTALGVYQYAVSTSTKIIDANMAELGLKQLRDYKKEADSIITSLRGGAISLSGIAENNERIEAPDGVAANWSIVVTPQKLIRPVEPGGSEDNNSIVGFTTKSQLDGEGWIISGILTYRNGPDEHQVRNAGATALGYILVRKSLPTIE